MHDKMTPVVNQVNQYDTQKSNNIAFYMFDILTALHSRVGVETPYDICEVWHAPTQRGKGWQYHAQCPKTENALDDPRSMGGYVKAINARARAVGAPLVVTAVHSHGANFVYDIIYSGN